MENPMNNDTESSPCLLSGFAAGCAGGFIATWVMSAMQIATVKVADELETRHAQTPQGAKTVAANNGPGSGPLENAQEGAIATKRLATAVSRRVFQHEISDTERAIAAQVIPLGFGTLVGGLYGLLAEHLGVVTLGHGAAYGAAVWLGAEEIALPALGLTKPPTHTKWSAHATGLAGHLVYGLALDASRRIIRTLLR
jgi:hypothetical protein